MEDCYYAVIFSNNIFKISALVFSGLSLVLANILLYGIVWYERYGNHQVRTLLNQLTASICWYAMAYSLLTQPVDMVLFIFGHLNATVCQVTMITKHLLAGCLGWTLNLTTLIRYIFVFWIKSPVSLDDSFFAVFLNLTNVLLHFLFNVSLAFTRDKISINNYICAGLHPNFTRTSNQSLTLMKTASVGTGKTGTSIIQWALPVVVIGSVAFQIFANIRIYRFKKKHISRIRPQSSQDIPMEEIQPVKSNDIENQPEPCLPSEQSSDPDHIEVVEEAWNDVIEPADHNAPEPKDFSGPTEDNLACIHAYQSPMLKSFSDVFINLFLACVYIYAGWTVSKLDKTDPKYLRVFPNYLLVYAGYLTNPNIIILSLVTLYYIRHQGLREAVWKGIQELREIQ